jgi:hypothetical protein
MVVTSTEPFGVRGVASDTPGADAASGASASALCPSLAGQEPAARGRTPEGRRDVVALLVSLRR